MTKITLNPIEQKYIGTCYPLPDREGIKECSLWKQELKRNYDGNNREFDIEKLKTPFPFIYAFFTAHPQKMIQDNFEALDENSHIRKLYAKATHTKINLDVLEKNPAAKLAYLKLLEHYEGCAVKVADLGQRLIWGYGGIYHTKIDENYFEKIKGRYAIIHGKSDNGLIVIREISEDEFRMYKTVFEEIQQRDNNPFRKYKNDLEKMLNSLN